jgi:hypothetical protein
MKDECDLCDDDASTVLTINIDSDDNAITQWNTCRCAKHIIIDYVTERKIIEEKVNLKLEAIHKKCTNNKEIIKNEAGCRCFYCQKIFGGDEVTEYIVEEKTALCPFCCVDAVLISSDSITVDKALLKQCMQNALND